MIEKIGNIFTEVFKHDEFIVNYIISSKNYDCIGWSIKTSLFKLYIYKNGKSELKINNKYRLYLSNTCINIVFMFDYVNDLFVHFNKLKLAK